MAKVLRKYSESSDLNNIRLKVGGETFKFNLYEELIIDENIINSEIKNQPSIYGFLGLLLVKLNRIRDDAEKEVERIYSDLFAKHKNKIQESTQRPHSDETAKAMVIKSEQYQKALEVFHKAKQDSSVAYTVVKSFEQRYSLIQTLSANLRIN